MRSLKTMLVLLFFLMVMGSSAEAMLYSGGYWIEQVMPATVGNSGKVTINIIGNMPNPPVHVSLWGPGGTESVSEIVGTVKNWSQDGFTNEWGMPRSVLTATFDLTGVSAGKYDVSFVNPEDPESISYSYGILTVDPEATSNLWVKITGRTQVRFGATTEYSIIYGNSGNTNCPSAVLYIAIPKEVNHTLLFDKAPYQKFLPEALKNSVYGSTSFDQSDVDFDGSYYDLIPLVIQDVPPLSITPLKVKITWGSQPVDYLLRVFWNGSKSDAFHPIWGAN